MAPSDNRLPDGGGYTISGLYNVKPEFFGRTNNLITLSDKYGDQSVVFNGVDLTVVARLRQDLTFQGGSNWGRTTSDTCEVRQQLPETAPLDPYCHVVSGYLPYFKGAGTYVVPHVDVQLGVSFISRPGLKTDLNGTPQGGAHQAANYTVSNAVVAQSLGRNLSGNAANVTVNILEPGLRYGDRPTSSICASARFCGSAGPEPTWVSISSTSSTRRRCSATTRRSFPAGAG